MNTATLYCDGGARPKNPGYSACAFVLTFYGQEPIKFSRYLGIGTNNNAEYAAMIIGLKYAKQESVNVIDIFTDSQLIVGHLTKGWTINPPLSAKVNLARELLGEFEQWSINWIEREKNLAVDELCTAACNWGRNKNPWTKKLKGILTPAYVLDPFNQSDNIVHTKIPVNE